MTSDGTAEQRDARTPNRVAIAFALLFVALASILSIPGAGDPIGAVASLVLTLGASLATPALWVLASVGMGLACLHALGRSGAGSSALALCVGVGLHLTIAHGLGALGLYAPSIRVFVAWTPVVAGLAMLIPCRRELAESACRVRLRWPILLAAPPVALLVVACAQPPGAIWSSEAHAYDSLSYHLQLPKAWHDAGIIAPLAHNVYSHLPSYIESAYTQLFAMHPGDPTAGRMTPLFSAHWLHAMLAIATFCVLAALVSSRTDRRAGIWAIPLALSIPWVIVVGSLAYNEMAVALMGAGALLALFDERLANARRGAVIGFLMGVAISAKPTSAFTLAIPIGLAMALVIPPRAWPRVALAMAFAGILTIAPWLVRNWVHAGNPVFPYATDLFGAAHWTSEQVTRWHGAHSSDAGFAQRLARLAGERGFGHRQWGIFAPLVALAFVASVARSRTRRDAIVLGAVLLAQILAWLSVGHLQSRFLLPTIVPGVAIVCLAERAVRSRSTSVVLALVALAFFALSTTNYLAQRRGNPNWALVPGASVFTEPLGPGTSAMRPEAFIRTNIDPSSKILLIGDAAALYYPRNVEYHTTWDASPLGEALERADGDIDGAMRHLREQGYDYALIDFDELERLTSDGWYDPRVTVDLAARLARRGTIIESWAEGNRLGAHLVALRRGAGDTRP